jgi:osmotically-inducible protein OsmY
MFLMDPDRGARRRALVRDKFNWAARKLKRAARITQVDLRNRAVGTLIEAKHALRREEAPDAVLEGRVRSKLGRKVSNPHAVHVKCQDGNVTLTGQVLASEASALLRCVGAVAGVHSVTDQLQLMENATQLSQAADPNHGLRQDRPRAVH